MPIKFIICNLSIVYTISFTCLARLKVAKNVLPKSTQFSYEYMYVLTTSVKILYAKKYIRHKNIKGHAPLGIKS